MCYSDHCTGPVDRSTMLSYTDHSTGLSVEVTCCDTIVLVLLMELPCYLTMTIALISLLMEHVIQSTGPVDGITMLSYTQHWSLC